MVKDSTHGLCDAKRGTLLFYKSVAVLPEDLVGRNEHGPAAELAHAEFGAGGGVGQRPALIGTEPLQKLLYEVGQTVGIAVCFGREPCVIGIVGSILDLETLHVGVVVKVFVVLEESQPLVAGLDIAISHSIIVLGILRPVNDGDRLKLMPEPS